MNLGKLHIERGVLLAPMEDVTDQAFRLICKRMGAVVVYTEFVPAEAIVRNIPAMKPKLAFSEDERPIGIQVYGNRADSMSKAAVAAASLQPDIIDINFGCPVKRVAGGDRRSCAGSGLLRFPDLMEELAASVADAARAFDIPVTAKTRLGWDDRDITILDTVARMERAGMRALTIHARTRQQMFKGNADWAWLRRAKEAASIPIIGNGDVVSADDAVRMLAETGVDAVMVGRGAIGKPWVFRQAAAILAHGTPEPEPEIDERIAIYLDHVSLAYILKGRRGVKQTRKHLRGYVSGFRDASDLRMALMQLEHPDEIRQTLVDKLGTVG
ncbi:tRNA dihydrouridine synthase DusB [Candidatus Poribacteria bacterium]|nr:tRNA dihydrouridine synthase DusB [Candidatus Poribacteria bacterium]